MAVPRGFRLVDEPNYRHFRRRWREIDQLWQACGDPEHWDVVANLRRSARAELRAELREAINVGPPIYLIAV